MKMCNIMQLAQPWDSSCGGKGCKRVNDSPNNTFRGLRIFADDYSLGSADVAFVQCESL